MLKFISSLLGLLNKPVDKRLAGPGFSFKRAFVGVPKRCHEFANGAFGKRRPFRHHRTMKVIRKSERIYGINCNKNGVMLDRYYERQVIENGKEEKALP